MKQYFSINDQRGIPMNICRLESSGAVRTVYLTRDSGVLFVLTYTQFNELVATDGFTDAESNQYRVVLPAFVDVSDLCAVSLK